MNDDHWPFSDPQNQATITLGVIMSKEHFVDYVSHDEDDGGWQFLSQKAGPFKMEDALLVSLESVISTDSTLAELADLPIGWYAWREAADQPWIRAKDDEQAT